VRDLPLLKTPEGTILVSQRSGIRGMSVQTGTDARWIGATVSRLLDLVSLGLVAAATIIIFGIASFSLLYTGEGMPRGSGIRDRGVEVKPVRSGVFPYTRANRPPLPAETELPGPAAEATLSTSPPERPAAGDMQTPEASRAQPALEPLPPGASEGSPTQDAAMNGTVPARPPEVRKAQSVSEPLPPGAGEGSATQDVETREPQPVSEPLPPGASEGSATQDASLSGTVLTRPPEVREAQSVSEPLPPAAGEGSATQDASLSGTVLTRPPEVREGQSVSEPLPPGAGEGSATQGAFLSKTVLTRPPEIIGAQPVSEPLPPGAGEESATQEVALIGTVPTLPIPAEKRDPVFRQFEMHQNVNLDGDNAVSPEKIPIQHAQKGQAHDHYFSTNADIWRYHLRKECGPIKDPALHRDCVRSFSAQYPIRYASPARTHQKS
jgi:hypothetical protein